ncbi:hypothetical protein N665_2899s0002 [Sinapis alba]|nr:hypothetical protein N665_2899s0002 [Sinapis alba]
MIGWIHKCLENLRDDDEAGLLAFKAGIIDDNRGFVNSWTKGTDCCSWYGVCCANHHRLKHINIERNCLSGPLPTNIGILSPHLETLILSGNQFTDFFKSMNKLRHLALSRNRLSGKLPPSLGRSLEFLELAPNNLSGTIPRYISRLTILDTLDLSNNCFSGAVPESLSKLTHLSDINISHNLLTNPFPVLKVTENLRHLDLSYNQFQMGTVPEWVTTMSFVFTVKLEKCGIKMSLNDWKQGRSHRYENEITGSPEHLLVNEGEMLQFQASGNKLRFDLGKLIISERLQTLDLSRNLVFGNVPGMVAGLFKLNLSQSHLCGKLPATRVFAGNDCLCGSPLPPCKG